MKRNYGGGRPPKLNDEIVELLESGLRSGRWNTAVQAQWELESGFGRSFPTFANAGRSRGFAP